MSHFAAGQKMSDVAVASRATQAEWCLMAFLLNAFLNSGGWQIISGGLSPGSDLTASEGSSFVQVIFVLFFLAAVFIARPQAAERWTSHLPFGMALALGWCWLSLSWALEPAIAVRRVALLSFVLVTIFSLVATAGWERALQIYIRSVAISVILYVVAALLLPAAVQSDAESAGAWRGLAVDKNATGAFAAYAGLLLVYAGLKRLKDKVFSFDLPVAALALLLLVQSKSKTSLAVFFLASVAGAGVVLCRRSAIVSYLASIAILGACLMLGLYSDAIMLALTDLANDPTSLTGRMQIWPPLVEYLSEHPWLGSGYGSFWSIGNDSPILPYARGYLAWLKTVPNAHNGYLEVAIQLGLIGLVLVLFAVFVQPAIDMFRAKLPPLMLWLGSATLIFTFFHNLLEAIIWNKAVIPWIMLVYTIALIHDFRKNCRKVIL